MLGNYLAVTNIFEKYCINYQNPIIINNGHECGYFIF